MTKLHAHNAGIVLPAAAGLGGVVIGVVVGLVVGANIGGNWFTSFSIAGQQGYEATALIGALVGAVALGVTGLWQGLRHQR